MTRVLFLCGKARMRGPTATDIVRDLPGVEADFAGLSRDVDDADDPASVDRMDGADIIAVMEQRQKKRLNALLGWRLVARRVVVLDAPDANVYGDPSLEARLKPRLHEFLRV